MSVDHRVIARSGLSLVLASLATGFVIAVGPATALAQDCPPDFSGDCGSSSTGDGSGQMPPEWTQVMGGDPTDPYSPVVSCGDPTCPENREVLVSTCGCPSR